MQKITCDVLVIGGGGAGLRAGIAARETGANVLVINRTWIGHSGATMMAVGAMAAVDPTWMSPGDSVELHLDDTLLGGCGINELELADSIVRGAAGAVRDLEKMGVWFDRDTSSGKLILLRPDGGHSKNRALSSSRRLGLEILQVLRTEALRQGVVFLEKIYAEQLLLGRDGSVVGALCLNTRDLECLQIEARAVVLATGGLCGLFLNTDVLQDIAGYGMSLALEAGAELMDMEFVQFHPMGLLTPESVCGLLGTHLSVVHLLNRDGDRFMAHYDPKHMEQTTRDVLVRAMANEIREGRGSPNGGIYGSMQHLTQQELEKKIPEYIRLYHRIGFDPMSQFLELAPTAHYTMGGVRVNRYWESSVKGLYAAGEVCAGVHGANRLSQNALTEMLVSGKTAGENACAQGLGSTHSQPVAPYLECMERRLKKLENADKGMSPGLWRHMLRRTMKEGAGVVRDQDGLEQAESELLYLAEQPMLISGRGQTCAAYIMALENEQMLHTALCLVRAARSRQESRGAHLRRDYPERNDKEFRCHFVFRKENEAVNIYKVPVGRESNDDC